MKNRRRTTTKTKRPNAPKVSGRRKPSSTNADAKIALFKRERDELLEQQKATAEVLRIISASPGDLKPVFDAMLANAVRLCEAKFGLLWLAESDGFRPVALHNVPHVLAFARRHDQVIQFGPETPIGRLAETRRLVHVADITSDPGYIKGFRPLRELADNVGARTLLLVPMLKHKELVGAFAIYRLEVRPFTDKQIEFVQNFAAQAVIAIENTRLLNELRQRTDDLTESLENQTATGEILGVISKSPTQVQPVFDIIAASALRLCGAAWSAVLQYNGEQIELAALHNLVDFDGAGALRRTFPRKPSRTGATDRAVSTRSACYIPDVLELHDYDHPTLVQVARSVLSVPMLRDGQSVGAITVCSAAPNAFTERQMTLLRTFADQAVIAIENVRLFEAEQQRTRELAESLEQQTATSEVLSVISSSPGELEPVFQAMLANAIRICEAKFGNLFLIDRDGCRWAAGVGTPPKLAEYFTRSTRFQPTPGSHLDRVVRTKQVSHTADDTAEAVVGAAARLGGARSTICVPMLKDDVLVGAIFIYRTEVRPFTEKQIELVKNFAAQAVIAIENTRLLNELRELLENQTASADILRAIASSPESAERALDVIAETTARRFGADNVNIRLLEGQMLRYVGSTGPMAAHLRELFPEGPLDPDLISGKAILERSPNLYSRRRPQVWLGPGGDVECGDAANARGSSDWGIHGDAQ